MEQYFHNSSNKNIVTSEPLDYAELKAERNELREAVKTFETELMQVCKTYHTHTNFQRTYISLISQIQHFRDFIFKDHRILV